MKEIPFGRINVQAIRPPHPGAAASPFAFGVHHDRDLVLLLRYEDVVEAVRSYDEALKKARQ